MTRRLLYWFSSRLPCRIISDSDAPYLERYYLFTLMGVRFYLHRFVASDPDRGLHDHPWPWAGSVILSGWYWEVTRSGRKKVRWLNFLLGDSFHRVVLPNNEPCWTLFFHRAAYVKPWGFLGGRGQGSLDPAQLWIPHNYPKAGDGTPEAWWEKAPRGVDEARRMPL